MSQTHVSILVPPTVARPRGAQLGELAAVIVLAVRRLVRGARAAAAPVVREESRHA